MSLAKVPKALLNLQKTTVLVADADIMGQNIIVQILIGFGARNIVRCEDAAEVRRHMSVTNFELVIIDPSSFGAEGYELVGWMRRELPPPNRHAPILVATGHAVHADSVSSAILAPTSSSPSPCRLPSCLSVSSGCRARNGPMSKPAAMSVPIAAGTTSRFQKVKRVVA